MSATIDRYLQKLTLLGDKVDLLSKDYVLAALLPHPTMVKIDNIRAQFLNFQTTLPDTLSLARKEYFDQGAMKYSTNEWLKVGLLLDEIEMTLNNLIGVGNKILQGQEVMESPQGIEANFIQVMNCMDMMYGLELP